MFIESGSIQIDGVDISNYIIDVEYSYNKLWSQNTGRSLSGKMTGKLLGIFPKFIVQFRPLTKNEIVTISRLLDKATQNFRYYDVNENQYKTIKTYTGDWSVKNQNINENEPFSVSFIAVNRR